MLKLNLHGAVNLGRPPRSLTDRQIGQCMFEKRIDYKRLKELVTENGVIKAGSYAFTVSPNPSVKHDVLRSLNGKKPRRINIPYGLLTHSEQYEYLQLYMKEVYRKWMYPSYYMALVYETNSTNNLHVHGICYMPDMKSDYDLLAFRKTVLSHAMTLYNMNKKGKPIDYMNNITKLTDINFIDYLNKQEDIKDRYPDEIYDYLCHRD